jgi:hypothetical protein
MLLSQEDRRRRPRISTMILAQLQLGAEAPHLTRVRDLSECGVRVATKLRLVPGQHVRVQLPGYGAWVLGKVAWVTQGVAGIAFLRAIDLPDMKGLRPSLAIAAGELAGGRPVDGGDERAATPFA